MYVYDCNYIPTAATKNRRDKEMVPDFIELTTYLNALESIQD